MSLQNTKRNQPTVQMMIVYNGYMLRGYIMLVTFYISMITCYILRYHRYNVHDTCCILQHSHCMLQWKVQLNSFLLYSKYYITTYMLYLTSVRVD